MSKQRYGQTGVGVLGEHFVSKLLKTYGALAVCDPDAVTLSPFEAEGAIEMSSPKTVAEHSEVIILPVPHPMAMETDVVPFGWGNNQRIW